MILPPRRMSSCADSRAFSVGSFLYADAHAGSEGRDSHRDRTADGESVMALDVELTKYFWHHHTVAGMPERLPR